MEKVGPGGDLKNGMFSISLSGQIRAEISLLVLTQLLSIHIMAHLDQASVICKITIIGRART